MFRTKPFLIALIFSISVFAVVLSCGGNAPTDTDPTDTTGQTSSPPPSSNGDTAGQTSSPPSSGVGNSVPASGSAASAPQEVRVTGLNATVAPAGITVSWNALPNSDGYELYWQQGSSVSILSQFVSAGEAATSHFFISAILTQGEQYSFAIRALLADGTHSQMSAPVTVTFGTPQDTVPVEATPINFNTTVTAFITNRNDFRWYVFTAQPGIQYTVTIRDNTNSTNPALTSTVRTSIYHDNTVTPSIRNSTEKDFPIHVDQPTTVYVRISVEADYLAGGFQIRVSDGSN